MFHRQHVDVLDAFRSLCFTFDLEEPIACDGNEEITPFPLRTEGCSLATWLNLTLSRVVI